MSADSVDITLSRELQQFCERQVATGRFRSVQDVVNAALHALITAERERMEAIHDLKSKIAVGLDEARAGKVSDGDDFFDELEREERANRGRKSA